MVGVPDRSEPAVEPERVADARNIGRCIVVETDSEMKVDLLSGCEAIAAAGTEEVTRSAV
jgi:hypothetical protein